MTVSEQSNKFDAELYGLLLQDIARGTVLIFGSLPEKTETPGHAGTIFSHDFMSTWEWSCKLMCDVGIVQPLYFDKATNEYVLAEKNSHRVAFFKLLIKIDDVAEHFRSRPAPDPSALAFAISVWIDVASFHGRVKTTRQPFEFEYIRTFPKGSSWGDFLEELELVLHTSYVDEARHVMDHLVVAGYATKSANHYTWTDKVAPSMQMLPALAWPKDTAERRPH